MQLRLKEAGVASNDLSCLGFSADNCEVANCDGWLVYVGLSAWQGCLFGLGMASEQERVRE